MGKRLISTPVIALWIVGFWALVFALAVFVSSNKAPGQPTIKWVDSPIRMTTRVEVAIDQPSLDPDGEEVFYEYHWTHNGEPIEGITAPVLKIKDIRKGDIIGITVIPNDGSLGGGWMCDLPWHECAGDPAVNAALMETVQNTPPTARVRFVDAEGKNLEEFSAKADIHVALSCYDPDFSAQRADEMRARAEAMAAQPKPAEGEEAAQPEAKPAEEDPCTYTVNWFPGEQEIEPGATSEFQGDTLPAATAKTAASWKVSVVANDGEADGQPVEATIYRQD